MSEVYANVCASVINQTGGIGAADTSVTVLLASVYPTGGQFRVICESEIMIVTAIAGNVLTITRGAEGTAAAAHANGTPITHILTAGGLTSLISTIPQGPKGDTGTPGVPGAGSNYFSVAAPASSGLTWVNQSTSTVSDDTAGTYLFAAKVTADQIRGLVKTLPSGNFDIQLGFIPNDVPGAFTGAGILLYDPVSGKCVTVEIQWTTAAFTAPQWAMYKFSSVSAFVAGYVNTWNPPASWPNSPLVWLRVVNDGTHWTAYMSSDGNHWRQFAQCNTNDYLTPTKYGFFVDPLQAANGFGMTVVRMVGP